MPKKKLKRRKISKPLILGAIAFCVLILFFIKVRPPIVNELTDFELTYTPKNFPHKSILISDFTPMAILKQRKVLKHAGFAGVVIYTVNTQNLKQQFWPCFFINKIWSNNYLAITLSTEQSPLPVWDDLKSWDRIIQETRELTKFAKRTGFNGIVIDTATYDRFLWNPEENDRYKTISDDFAKKVIYQRARETILAIEEESPEIELIIYPLDAAVSSTNKNNPEDYYHWIHYINGFSSTKHAKGFLFLDSAKPTVANIPGFTVSANRYLENNLDEKVFYKEHCQFAFSTEINDSFRENYLKLQTYHNSPVFINIISPNFTAAQEHFAIIRLINKPETGAYLRNKLNQPYSILDYLPSKIKYYWERLIANV
jgi:hypothetical protein